MSQSEKTLCYSTRQNQTVSNEQTGQSSKYNRSDRARITPGSKQLTTQKTESSSAAAQQPKQQQEHQPNEQQQHNSTTRQPTTDNRNSVYDVRFTYALGTLPEPLKNRQEKSRFDRQPTNSLIPAFWRSRVTRGRSRQVEPKPFCYPGKG